VHWSSDGWQTSQNTKTRDTGMGVQVADLPTGGIPSGGDVLFTIFWEESQRWEGVDFCVYVDKR
jgi:glucoamylase